MSVFHRSIIGSVLTCSFCAASLLSAAWADETVGAMLEMTTDLAPQARIITMVVEATAGTELPPHSNGGPGVATLLSGEVDIVFPDGTTQHLKPGDVFEEEAGMVHGAVVGSADARILWTVVLPDGAELETPFQG